MMTMRATIFFAITLLGPQVTLAALAPKFDRVEQIEAALQYLREISSSLSGPIDKIDYSRGEVRFSAGSCFVPVIVTPVPMSQNRVGKTDYTASVGKLTCQ